MIGQPAMGSAVLRISVPVNSGFSFISFQADLPRASTARGSAPVSMSAVIAYFIQNSTRILSKMNSDSNIKCTFGARMMSRVRQCESVTSSIVR